jgi:hypothetical protein
MALVLIVLLLLGQAEINTDYELAMWEGTLGLSFMPVLLGLAILIISISGTLVSGTRFVNKGLTEGDKSHNPIWGVLIWFIPFYGLYKAFVMGRSIERATGTETNTTSKLFLGFVVSWILGVVSEASSRTDLEPQTFFLTSLLLFALVAVIWFYMAFQTYFYLNELRQFTLALNNVERVSLETGLASEPSTKSDDVIEHEIQKFCTNCGQRRSLGSKFCGECGSPFEG